MGAPTEQVLVIGCDMPYLTAPFLVPPAERGRDAITDPALAHAKAARSRQESTAPAPRSQS
jgi:molybdopterin-guanine dinucleotide biosynthesis protein A